MVEDTAANIRETSRLPQSYSIAVGAKRKKCTSSAGRVSRSATAFNFCIQGQIRLRRHLVIGSQGELGPGSEVLRYRCFLLGNSLLALKCPMMPLA